MSKSRKIMVRIPDPAKYILVVDPESRFGMVIVLPKRVRLPLANGSVVVASNGTVFKVDGRPLVICLKDPYPSSSQVLVRDGDIVRDVPLPFSGNITVKRGGTVHLCHKDKIFLHLISVGDYF